MYFIVNSFVDIKKLINGSNNITHTYMSNSYNYTLNARPLC